MLQEFKEFILRGNVLELAVAVIIAGAFGAIVTSLTNDVLLPPIGEVMGGVDFSDLKYVLSPEVVGPDGTVVSEGAAIRYGNFIQKVIDFIIIAFVVFLVVKAYNRAMPKEPEAPAPEPGPTEVDLLKEIRDQLARRPL